MKPKNKDFFGGLFDFNGDGKTDLGEQFIAFQMFEAATKEQEQDDLLDDLDALDDLDSLDEEF